MPEAPFGGISKQDMVEKVVQWLLKTTKRKIYSFRFKLNLMSYYVYMLKSKDEKPVTYVGYTSNLKNRIKLHNSGKGAKFTVMKMEAYF